MNKIVKSFLEKYLAEVKKNFHPKEMWLWGSYVYGNPKEDSDIDIALISKDFKQYRFIKRSTEVANRLRTWADKDLPDIDFLCYTPEEFEKKKKEIGLAKEIVERGIKIL